jgi:aminopeptidase-like protein
VTNSSPVRHDQSLASAEAGIEAYRLIERLFPICRSITGDGVRETLAILAEQIPLEEHEVPSGTQVFDWTVPPEWNIRDAYVKDPSGRRVIDFARSNLHVVGYSVPVAATLALAELKERVHTLPERPDWVPYRTSYYKESWGFCASHALLESLAEGDYEVRIDSTLEPGQLTYGECVIPGETGDEVLISCHVCHPSLCNDGLSSIAVATELAKRLSCMRLRYSYRFLFVPGTIGPITWLSLNEQRVDRIKHGLVLSCVGDAGHSTYKRSRRGDADVDRAAAHVLGQSGQEHRIVDFSPWGYDERQYCSPGFNLPVGCLMRTPNGEFPEYHTSADDLTFVQPEHLGDSYARCLEIVMVLEGNRRHLNLNPKCEPQLGKRGIYSGLAAGSEGKEVELAMLWVLNYSDGRHDLLDIAERSRMPFRFVRQAADLLIEHDLLREHTS